MTSNAPTPTLARRRLGKELRRLRTSAALNPTEAAKLINVVRQTITRMENGLVETKPERVEYLCKRYGATADEITELTRMAIKGGERGWWERHKRGLTSAFRMYAESEREAASLETYEPEYLPGLVQTAGYIRALQATAAGVSEDTEVSEIIDVRLERQRKLYNRTDNPRIRILLGLGAMAYLDQLNDVKTDQCDRLREISTFPNVDLRIVAGLHTAMGATFTTVSFGDNGDPPFVYMDAMDGCRYVEDQDVVSSYQRAFQRAFESAIPMKEYLNGR